MFRNLSHRMLRTTARSIKVRLFTVELHQFIFDFGGSVMLPRNPSVHERSLEMFQAPANKGKSVYPEVQKGKNTDPTQPMNPICIVGEHKCRRSFWSQMTMRLYGGKSARYCCVKLIVKCVVRLNTG
jgi:hypothetical protein